MAFEQDTITWIEAQMAGNPDVLEATLRNVNSTLQTAKARVYKKNVDNEVETLDFFITYDTEYHWYKMI